MERWFPPLFFVAQLKIDGMGVMLLPFNHVDIARQLVSFDGMYCNGASLSDIDFCLELHNRMWVIGEVKRRGVPVPLGQRVFLEHFVKMARDGGRHAIAIVVEHDVWNSKDPVMLRDCQVKEYYTTETGRWAYPRRPYYVEEMINQYINMYEGGGYGNGQVASNGNAYYGYKAV